MSYDRDDLGYDMGYDSPTSRPKKVRVKVAAPQEGPPTVYQMVPPVPVGTNQDGSIQMSDGSNVSPGQGAGPSGGSGDAGSAAGAGKGNRARGAGGARPAPRTNYQPKSATIGQIERSNRPNRSLGDNGEIRFETHEFPAVQELSSRGLSDEQAAVYLKADPYPKQGAKAQEAWRSRVNEAGGADGLMKAADQKNVEGMMKVYQDQGITPDVAYANMDERGMIDREGMPPPENWDSAFKHLPPPQSGRSAQDIANSQADVAHLKKNGLTPAGRGDAAAQARNNTVKTDTARRHVVNGWIDSAQKAGWSQEQAEGVLTQLEPPLMRNGEMTQFEPTDAAKKLYSGLPEDYNAVEDAGGRFEALHEEGVTANLPGRTPEGGEKVAIKPGAGNLQAAEGDDAITAATVKFSQRSQPSQTIYARLTGGPGVGYGLTESQAKGLMASDALGSPPLFDANGNPTDEATPEQLEAYQKGLDERWEKDFGDYYSSDGNVEGKYLTPDGQETDIQKSRRTAGAERAEETATRRGQSTTRDLLSKSATYYRTNLPGAMHNDGGMNLTPDEINKYNNGRGYYGENPNLQAMARDLERFKGARGADARTMEREVRDEIAQEGYVRPVGGGSAGVYADAVDRAFSRGQNQQAGGQGRGGPNFSDQETLALERQSRDHDFQRETEEIRQNFETEMQGRRETHEAGMEGIRQANALELEGVRQGNALEQAEQGHRFRIIENSQNNREQLANGMVNTIFSGLMEMIRDQLRVDNERLSARVEAGEPRRLLESMFQGSLAMGRG